MQSLEALVNAEILDRVDPMLRERFVKIAHIPARTAGVWATPEQAAAYALMDEPYSAYEPPNVAASDQVIPGPHGEIPVRIYKPNDRAAVRGIVWIHGGAFMLGDLDMPEADHVSRELCARLDAAVVSVDYRLANDDVHFPVPLDDVVAAWNWAVLGSELLPDGVEWIIGGGSAGACLAESATLRLRDGEGPLPRAVLAIYPVMHRHLPADEDLQADLAVVPPCLLGGPILETMYEVYLGDHSGHEPEAFAGDAKDLTGLPPTLMVVCEFDELRSTGEVFASQLRAAGSPVQLHRELGVSHGHLNTVGLPAAARTLDVMTRFVLERRP